MSKEINILGVIYTIEEVDIVDRYESKKGEIDFLTNTIKIDRNLSRTSKEQTLMHEILHATFDLLGLYDDCEDEQKVQCLATALHLIFTTQSIFS